MKTVYRMNVRSVKSESGEMVAVYGIDAISEDGIVRNSIIDAFDDPRKAEELARICTELELAPEHLQDVIEDAM